jgi:hypothetical protein
MMMDPLKTISIGDLVKEHTQHSRGRIGLVHKIISNYYLVIKWLDGSVDKRHRNKYEVTKIIKGEAYPNYLQDYIQGKRW